MTDKSETATEIDDSFCKLDTLIGHTHTGLRRMQGNLNVKVTRLDIKVGKDSTGF